MFSNKTQVFIYFIGWAQKTQLLEYFYNRFCFKRNSIFLKFNLNSCNGYCLEGTAMTICLASASGAPGRKLELNKYHFLCKLRPSKTSHLKISTSDICFNTAVSNHLFIAFGAACCQSSRKLEIQQLSCQVWFLALQGSVLVWGVCICMKKKWTDMTLKGLLNQALP